MTTPLPRRVEIRQDVLYQVLDGEAVLLDLKNDHYFGLDEVGTSMWRLMGQEVDLEHVVAQLETEYRADGDTIRQGLRRLITDLAQVGLITVHE